MMNISPRGLQSHSEVDCVARCWEALTGISKEKLNKMLGLYPGMSNEEVITSWEVAHSRNLWVNPDWEMVVVLMAANPISGHAILRSRPIALDDPIYWDPFYGYLNQLPENYLEILTLRKKHYQYMNGKSIDQAIRWLTYQNRFSHVNLKEIEVKEGQLTINGKGLLRYIAENIPLKVA